jgi:hypothetical protein
MSHTSLSINPDSQMALAAHNFHSLAVRYSSQLCITTAGGSANVAAGMFGRRMQLPYRVAHKVIDFMGGENWYYWLGLESIPMAHWDDLYPWEAKDLVDLMAAAIKAAKRGIKLRGLRVE